jgi:hypothetical protein
MATGRLNSKLDAPQIAREVFDADSESIKVRSVGGSLVPNVYDAISLTYVASGNGVGEIETAVYKLDGTTIATLTLSYDSSNRLVNVVKS